MNKVRNRLITLSVFLLILLAIYDLFHVSGRDIDLIAEMNESCTVTVDTYEHMKWEERETKTLNGEQITALKELILETDFTRDFSSMRRFYDQDQYDIRIDFNNGTDFVSISCTGGEYLTVTNQFDGGFLTIKNPNWKTALEAILAMN